ncbi:MAG: amidohydrolase family protein [Lentisphaeria bacterium]|nr:amidohydrolase family protein [Lentisphaeria bacterium]
MHKNLIIDLNNPISDFDREIWYEELEDFVPAKIFDAHAHLWHNRYANGKPTPYINTDFETLDKFSKTIFPNREIDYLLLATPFPGTELKGYTEFMGEEIAKSPSKIGSTVVTPEITPEELANSIEKYNFRGLKPYRLFAKDPANCRITDYLPESFIEVADEYKLCITMHMSRFDGIADEQNLADFKYFTSKYKNVRWILAHCARAFNPYTLEKNIFVLRDMPNIYYDTSAVCDSRTHYLLFKHENKSRLMFGTDNIDAGGVHAKYITWGKGWQFFPGMDVPHCRPDATLVCYENLRSTKQAADMAGITNDELQDIFYGNAKQFFGIE